MTTRVGAPWTAAAFVLCLFGCTQSRVKIDPGSQIDVRFESPRARQVFATAMQERQGSGKPYFVSTCVWRVLLIPWLRRETFHETAFHNEQIRRADVDADRVIADAEADQYSRAGRERTK